MTLENKTSHNGQFFKIEIYTSSEYMVDVWFVRIVTIFGRDTTI